MADNIKSWKNKLSNYASVRTREDDASTNQSNASITEKEKTRFSRIKAFGRDGWTLEILSALNSLLGFIGIIAVLGFYDGRIVTSLPHGITLNGIISILATITKATLSSAIAAVIGQCRWLQYADSRPNKLQSLQIIEDASRGPRGSIMLVLTAGMRPLAIFGAILTIISIGFDPSLQLLIHTDVRSIFVDDTGASIVPVMSFNDADYYNDGLSLAYRDAVISALSDNAPSFDMVPVCPSKNCTWPEYQNLRMTSKCKSITHWIYYKADYSSTDRAFCDTTCPYQTESTNGTLVDDCPGGDEESTICTYVMPQPFGNFSDGYETMGNVEIQQPVLFGTALPGYDLPDTEAASLLDQPQGQYPLAVTATLREPPSADPDAWLCTISFRLETLNTSVEDGVVSTRVMESMSLANISSWQPSNADQEDQAILHFITPAPDGAGETSRQDLRMPWWTFELLNETLPTYFNGTLLQDDSISHVQYSSSPGPGSEILAGMAKTTDFGAMMDRVAAAMSKRMREVGGTVLTGQSGSMEIYFRIRWGWIVLPTLVMVGGIGLLAIAIFETIRHRMQVWKSSSLPLLYSASDCDLKRDSDPVTLSQMESLADRTMVRLQRSTSLGWAFQRTSTGNEGKSLL